MAEARWVGGAGPIGGAGGPRRCMFCGRREAAVEHLVRARGATICDRCVGQAGEAIAAAPPGKRLVRMRIAPPRVGDREAAEEAVELAFEAVFAADAGMTEAERCRLIERGGNLAPTMRLLSERYPPGDVDVSVGHVRFVSEDEAEVHFVLHLDRFGPSGLHHVGHGVRVDGEWKVSRDTWCRLAAMGGVPCPPPDA